MKNLETKPIPNVLSFCLTVTQFHSRKKRSTKEQKSLYGSRYTVPDIHLQDISYIYANNFTRLTLFFQSCTRLMTNKE